MLVTLSTPSLVDRRDELLDMLADFHIFGDLVAVEAAGPVHRYRIALTGAKKVSRVVALAPDIARELAVLSASVRALDHDGLIEIALVTAPYITELRSGTAAWLAQA